MTIRLSIDCMGGDHGPSVTVPAALEFLRQHHDVELTLVGQQSVIENVIAGPLPERLSIVHASEIVAMDDPIEIALRRKRDSSMRVAIQLLKQGEVAGCVSAGNTGALMALSRFVLKTLPGIDRPAIAAAMPNELGTGTTMLDLGANADCEPLHFLQFARMASVMLSTIHGKPSPSVGLLNIGEEAIKGNEVVKQAGELLRAASDLNFYGNVEGNDIFKGTTDIVVCDGFVGNVALKTGEGLAKMMSKMLRQEFTRSIFTRFVAIFAMPILKRFMDRVDHRRMNGAVLLGLRGLVVKSHGSADAYAFGFALLCAYKAAQNGMVQRIAQAFEPNPISSSAPLPASTSSAA
jgi:phosphate acyltransferase